MNHPDRDIVLRQADILWQYRSDPDECIFMACSMVGVPVVGVLAAWSGPANYDGRAHVIYLLTVVGWTYRHISGVMNKSYDGIRKIIQHWNLMCPGLAIVPRIHGPARAKRPVKHHPAIPARRWPRAEAIAAQ